MLVVVKKFLKLFSFGVIAIFVFILIINIVIYATSRSHIYEEVADVPSAQTGLILGAAVFSSGKLSPIFKNRVDKAIELYKAKKILKILVSGDNSTVSHNEVEPVRDYLLASDIPDGDIFLDYAGFDTYSTMYRARDIFKVSSVVIVSQSFHLPRAVFIAHRLGLDASGISADDGQTPFKNYFREIFANVKAVFNLVFGREPKFLGEVIPINENPK